MHLGIDLGTSGLRALLVDGAGEPVMSAQCPFTVSNPRSGWSEQDPAQWIDALDRSMRELLEKGCDIAGIESIGVAGHMHGATLLDRKGGVIRPCILWNDTRSHFEAAELDQAPQVRELSGNIVFPGFTAPKLAWVQKHEPENFTRTAKVLLPAAFLNFYLTGEYVADMSDSAGTSWLDVARRDWSDTLLRAGCMRREQMPALVEGCQQAGLLRRELAERWGIKGEVVVAGGAGDNAAAACGTGVLAEGQGFVSLGTSGVELAARNGYIPKPESAVHTFCHAIPNRWYQMGVMLSATDSLNWFAGISGRNAAELTAALGTALSSPGPIRFMPYLSGERTPHNDADIRGAFIGLGSDTSVDAMTRAVLEGVSFGLRDSAEALKSCGAKFDQVLAIGGGSASGYWVELLATVLDTPLHLPVAGEFGAALGAARLGLCAATGEPPESVMTAPEIRRIVEPRAALVDAFDEAYARFRSVYPGLRAIQ